MRSDVNKVLTECYKEGGGSTPKFPRHFTNERFHEVGGKIGIRHEHMRAKKHWTKSFGENLGYLPGFLRKNVGRSWDAVYSELCKSFDRRSAVNAHIFQHLFDYFVQAKDIVEVDGKLYVRGSHYQRDLRALDDGYEEMYVDPRDGILKRIKKGPKEKTRAELQAEELAKLKRVLSPTQEMHNLSDGLWYVFTLSPIPEPTISYVFGEKEPNILWEREAWEAWCIEVRNFKQLSRQEQSEVGVKVVKKPNLGYLDRKIPEGNKAPCTFDSRARGKHIPARKATHYYSSMRSASKKELRSVGL